VRSNDRGGGGSQKKGEGRRVAHEEIKTRRPSQRFALSPFSSPSAVDRHRFDADPDPTFPFNADPDPDSDPVPGSYHKFYNVRNLPVYIFVFFSLVIGTIIFNILGSILKFSRKKV
jgi:hypothetical protein